MSTTIATDQFAKNGFHSIYEVFTAKRRLSQNVAIDRKY